MARTNCIGMDHNESGFLRRMATCLIILFLISVVSSINEIDILTIQKGNHVKCITEDITSPIYILPLIAEDAKYNSSLVVNGTWIDDDFQLRNEKSPLPGVIADKRWEQFKTISTKYQRFTFVTSLAMSIYATPGLQIQLFMSDKTSDVAYKQIEQSNMSNWIHLQIVIRDENLLILQNNNIIREKENFVPVEVTVKTSKETYWKIHEYNYKWANTISKDKFTSLSIAPTSEKQCLIFYAFLCEDCFLEIRSSTSKELHQINGRPSTRTTQSWQFLKVDTEPDEKNTFTFHRGRNDDRERGEWAIDVRSCNEIDNKVIYKVYLPQEDQQNRECHSLEEQASDLNTTVKRITSESEIFHCAPGFLGRKCNISCEALLGSENQYCQERRICVNSECKCAWGFKEPSCQTGCDNGYWGLSCENKCNSTCQKCNITTGECGKIAATTHFPSENSENLDQQFIKSALIILVPLLVILIIILLVIWLRIRNSKNRHDISDLSGIYRSISNVN